ncbi:ead/Ea22-like family protein [Escherichia coli O53]|nr:ead/Ea22-like family protein [Escherichia coli O53]
MSNIDKRALRKAAMHAKTTDDWGYDNDNFHDKATPDVVLALLDELEAKDKRIAELERELVVMEAVTQAMRDEMRAAAAGKGE